MKRDNYESSLGSERLSTSVGGIPSELLVVHCNCLTGAATVGLEGLKLSWNSELLRRSDFFPSKWRGPHRGSGTRMGSSLQLHATV
jgi:hypothetical protein